MTSQLDLLISRLNDPEQYADAIDEAIALLKAQAAEIERLTNNPRRNTHEVQVRCTKCMTDITIMVYCEQSKVAEKAMESVGRGVFGFRLVNDKPYCEKCARVVAP